MVEIIVSGGQTGVDRVALEVAEFHGIATAGWAPRGWRTDEGPAPELGSRFSLVEHASSAYPPRTFENVKLASATVLFGDMGSPGCRLTIRYCIQLGRPYFVNPDAITLASVLQRHRVVNFAGNRARTNPEAYRKCGGVLTEAIEILKNLNPGEEI